MERPVVKAGDNLGVSVKLKNTGERTAAEVVQFYLSDLDASATVPRHHLVGFERVTLRLGESRRLLFSLTPEMLSFFDQDGKLKLETGFFRLEVGGVFARRTRAGSERTRTSER